MVVYNVRLIFVSNLKHIIMKKIQTILRTTEFESSSVKTKQFTDFVKTFKSEFKKEMAKVGATDIEFNIGHFYISGFFNVGTKLYYFSFGDIRGMNYQREHSLMYRTAQHRKDWTGGSNQWVTVDENMANQMKNNLL